MVFIMAVLTSKLGIVLKGAALLLLAKLIAFSTSAFVTSLRKTDFENGIAKPCTNLHPVQSTSTQLHLPPLSSFQPPHCPLQHLQRYNNQKIARNKEVSSNLGRKIQICPFCLKVDTHGILEVVIPNSDLDF